MIKIIEFSDGGELVQIKTVEFSAGGELDDSNAIEFSAAENSKIGKLEAENSKRGTRKLPASRDLRICSI